MGGSKLNGRSRRGFGAGKGRELRGRQSLAVLLVAGPTVSVPAIDFGAEDKQLLLRAGESRLDLRFAPRTDRLPLQRTKRRLIDRIQPCIAPLARRVELDRRLIALNGK